MVDVGKYTIHWVFGDRLMPTKHVNDHVSCFGRAILPAHVECRYFESWKPIVSVECPFKRLWWRMDMHVFTHNMCFKYVYIYRLEKLKSSCFLVLVVFHSPPSDDESRILCESLCRFTAACRSWPGVGRWRRDRHEQKPGELRPRFFSLTVGGVDIWIQRHVFFAEYTIYLARGVGSAKCQIFDLYSSWWQRSYAARMRMKVGLKPWHIQRRWRFIWLERWSWTRRSWYYNDLCNLGRFQTDVSKNRGTPKWMVYDGKPY